MNNGHVVRLIYTHYAYRMYVLIYVRSGQQHIVFCFFGGEGLGFVLVMVTGRKRRNRE